MSDAASLFQQIEEINETVVISDALFPSRQMKEMEEMEMEEMEIEDTELNVPHQHCVLHINSPLELNKQTEFTSVQNVCINELVYLFVSGSIFLLQCMWSFL